MNNVFSKDTSRQWLRGVVQEGTRTGTAGRVAAAFGAWS